MKEYDNYPDKYPDGDILAQAEYILRHSKRKPVNDDSVGDQTYKQGAEEASLFDVRNALHETYESKYPDLAQPYIDFSRHGGVLTPEGESLSREQLEELALISDEYGRRIRIFSKEKSDVMKRLNSAGNSEIQYFTQQRMTILKLFQLSREKIVEEIDYSIVLGQIVSDPPKLTVWEKLRNLKEDTQKSFFKSIIANRISHHCYALPSDLSDVHSFGGELAEYLLLQQVQRNTSERVDTEVKKGR